MRVAERYEASRCKAEERRHERSKKMKRVVLILAITALALPASAVGKGPSEAVISGPGGGDGDGSSGITFKGCCADGTPTMMLAERAGFFAAAFGQQPDPMLGEPPAGALGPKYTITYTVPGPNNETWKIKQDLYPYAADGPLTYMKPGQELFENPGGTPGGWFPATSQLKEMLVDAGLPVSPPSGAANRRSVPTLMLGAIVIAVFAVAALFIVRRRLKPAARMAGSPT